MLGFGDGGGSGGDAARPAHEHAPRVRTALLVDVVALEAALVVTIDEGFSKTWRHLPPRQAMLVIILVGEGYAGF